MTTALSSNLSKKVTINMSEFYSKLNTDDPSIIQRLHNKFKFIPNDYWILAKKLPYLRGKGVRYVKFFDLKGKFPTGIVQEVVSELNNMGVEVEKIDERKIFHEKLEYDEVRHDIFNNHISLYDYQVDVANTALEKKRGIVKCATGGGKTIIFTSIIKAMKCKYPTMVLCRNKNLVTQTYQTFVENGLTNVGRVNMDYYEPNLITCATVQSIHKIKPLVEGTKVLILDEVHEWTTTESIKHLQSFRNAVYRLGFSATPFKQNNYIHNYRLKSWVGPLLCDIDITSLRDREILSEAHVHFYPVVSPDCINDDKDLSYLEVETKGMIENYSFHRKVVEIVNSIPEGRILILVKRLSHGDILKDLIPEAHWVRGEDTSETRELVLQELRQSKQKKVIAILSSIGFYGLNVYVHHLINASGGKEPNMLIQKIGRGLRKSFDKDKLDYYDFLFTGENYLSRHSRVRMQVLKQEGHKVSIEA